MGTALVTLLLLALAYGFYNLRKRVKKLELQSPAQNTAAGLRNVGEVAVERHERAYHSKDKR